MTGWAAEADARRLVVEAFGEHPIVGTGVTFAILNDAHPYRVIAVHGERRITVLANRTPLEGRMVEYAPDVIVDLAKVLTKRADGHWVVEGEPGGRQRVGTWTIGEARTYRGEDWR